MQKVESFLMNVGKQKQALLTSAFSSFTSLDILSPKNNANAFNGNCERFRLTSREKDIAQLICKGNTYKAIAAGLYISVRTVTTHVQNIFEKLKVSNKIEVINKLEC